MKHDWVKKYVGKALSDEIDRDILSSLVATNAINVTSQNTRDDYGVCDDCGGVIHPAVAKSYGKWLKAGKCQHCSWGYRCCGPLVYADILDSRWPNTICSKCRRTVHHADQLKEPDP